MEIGRTCTTRRWCLTGGLLFASGSSSLPVFGQPVILTENFEDSVLDPKISIVTTGTFASSSGIKSFTGFGSTKAFGYGRSNCGASCFNNFVTRLKINLSVPTYVTSVSFKEMEGNLGSTGLVYVDGASSSAFEIRQTRPSRLRSGSPEHTATRSPS